LADQAQIELVISAQADRVLAGLASFERSLKNIEKSHETAGAAAVKHSTQIDHLTSKVSNLANIGNLFVAWQAVEQALSVFKGLETFNIDLLHTTQLLSGNAEAASTWSAIANVMGIDVNLIDRAFAKLSVAVNSGANPALKQMGIATEYANGKLLPLNDVLNQAADYFHAHAGAVNNAALANELFGRGGYQLLPVLEQGSAGLHAFTEEARKYGLILDAEAIQRNAAFTFQLKEAEMAVRGFGISLLNGALPGIAALGQGLSKIISDNLPAFIAGVQRAMSYLMGFVEAFVGTSLAVDAGAMALSDFSSVVSDTGEAQIGAGNASKILAEQQRQITDATRDATSAIDDQIRALNAQMAATSFADKQAQLAQQVAAKEKDINKLREQQYQEFWLGNFANARSVADQIVAAKQQEEDLKLQITRSGEDNSTKLKIAGLEEQKRGINSAAQNQIEALQRAAAAGGAAMATMAGGMPPLFNAAGKAAAEKFKFAMDAGAEATGLSMGKKLQDALLGPEIWVDSDRKIQGHFERKGGQSFGAIGTAIGESIAAGMTTAVGRGFADWWNKKFIPGIKNYIAQGGGEGEFFRRQSGNQLSFASGGMVPGPVGVPQIAVVHGGERVLTPEQQQQNMGADMTETNSLLSQLLAAVLNAPSSGGSTGTDAMVNELIERVSRQRARGMVGSYAR
jgi:hypothetical protein